MLFAQRDHIFGSALMQIVEHEKFETLERLESYGHYEINRNMYLSLAYEPGEYEWTFTLDGDALGRLRDHRARARASGPGRGTVYLCLICGRDGVCLLKPAEWDELLEFGPDLEAEQHITIERPFRHQMEVTGTHGELDHKIARTRFPDALFESEMETHEETEPIQLKPHARISPGR